jgi:hypothetical protein
MESLYDCLDDFGPILSIVLLVLVVPINKGGAVRMAWSLVCK